MFSPIELTLKPVLRRKFGFSEIHTVTFMADYTKDTLDMLGEGIIKDQGPSSIKGETESLSKNKKEVEMFIGGIEAHIKDIYEYKQAALCLNFQKKEIIAQVRYLSVNGFKKEQTIKTPF